MTAGLHISSNAQSYASIVENNSSSSNYANNNNSNNSNGTIGVFSADSKPYGLSYGEWTAKWWQWAYSVPKDFNPAYGDTGKYCNEGQNGPVWFLTSAYQHPVERYCKIPSDKPILLTILNSECSLAESPKLKTEKELRQCAKDTQDSVVQLQATIDGKNITNLQDYRIQSPLFNFTLPSNNILNLPPQTTQSVSDGNWIFVKPLSIGKHIITFKGGLKNASTINETNSSSKFEFAGPYGWDNKVTYYLTITNSSSSSPSSSS